MVASAYGRYSKKTGTIIVLDARNVPLYRIEFFDAQVTSFVMPALSRSSSTSAYFSASFRPTSIKHTADGNKATSGSTALPAQKVWNASNFRFRVGDVPLDDGAVTKVSSISLSTAIKPVHFGKDRLPELEPTKTSYSNVVITVPMSEASGILSWAEEVVSGRGFDSSDKTASLEYMAPGDKITYYTAELKGLGIVSAAVSKSGAESSKDVIAELYYDSIKLSYI
jgi:hypothetical protein